MDMMILLQGLGIWLLDCNTNVVFAEMGVEVVSQSVRHRGSGVGHSWRWLLEGGRTWIEESVNMQHGGDWAQVVAEI